ncbi:Uncharacterized protein BP5553_07824 [Venustampulla echinocandica]|uniref:Cyclase n=1 Tax=Venustampulla echinocandica TaxID=2656787 RepID=A0A370THM4_9HELO|nr:Uncharacterized protein BP5553_07824 [Venustampulla echinocandica]RDL34696.1 Uncharacterized protein BP5553_07824 [Venustampulla echinocandica]
MSLFRKGEPRRHEAQICQSCKELACLSTSISTNDESPQVLFQEAAKQKAKASVSARPAFESLPLMPDHPKSSSWGLWGNSDELGTLNLLTEEVVRKASEEIRTGRVVPLNLPLDCPLRPMNPLRKQCEHRINAKGHANDDELDLNTQSSSHWDGLRHYPYQQTLQYYNGATQSDISSFKPNYKIGVQNIAQKGIAGRGVLLDWRHYALKYKIKYSPFEAHAIPLSQLLEVAAEQNVQFCPGDILLIRSGWLEEYNKLTTHEQDALGRREKRTFCGVEASRDSIKWHWDNAFAAVAGDTTAYEAWPSLKPWGVSIHEVFLSGWGMPIGETWDLEGLAQACRELGKWTFFLTSQPLNIKGGVASPANVMAIL